MLEFFDGCPLKQVFNLQVCIPNFLWFLYSLVLWIMMPFPHSVPVAQQSFGFVSIQCFHYLSHKVFLTMDVMFSSFSKELIQTYSGICNFFYIFFQNEFMPLSAFLSFSILMINAKKERWKSTTFQIYQELCYKLKKYYTREKKKRVHLEEREQDFVWKAGEKQLPGKVGKWWEQAGAGREGCRATPGWVGGSHQREQSLQSTHLGRAERRGRCPTERQTNQLGDSSVKYATEPWIEDERRKKYFIKFTENIGIIANLRFPRFISLFHL